MRQRLQHMFKPQRGFIASRSYAICEQLSTVSTAPATYNWNLNTDGSGGS